MPTLFTALQSHAERLKQKESQRRPIAGPQRPFEQISGIGSRFAEVMSEEIPRRRRLKQTTPPSFPHRPFSPYWQAGF
jgi:hypothetical protein